MSLMRRVCFLSVVAALAVCIAGAQSSPSPNPSVFGPNADGESSSAAIEFVAPEDFDGASALAAAAAEGRGSSAEQGNHGWKHEFSNNLALEAGAGFNGPIGNDTPYITWGGNFTFGAGLHLSKAFSVLAEYQFMDNKLPGAFIADVGTQGGNAHIWSLTLDPVVDLLPKKTNSIYVTGGGGFYRKLTSFTDPEEGVVCTYYCGIVVENATVYHFSSNQGGANLGLGLSHKLGGRYSDGKSRLFAEARYTVLGTPSITSANGTGSTALIPVTFGIRW
jgi:hypothetical protein